MVHEMQRQGFSLPLMIGGATTSKAHTAVKIDPQYSNDAWSMSPMHAVGVATTLLSKELKPAFVDKTREEYAMIRERTANRSARTERLSYLDAIANKPPFDWSGYAPVKPSFTGRRCWKTSICAPWSTTSTGRLSSLPGTPASIRASSKTRWLAKRPPRCSTMPRPC